MMQDRSIRLGIVAATFNTEITGAMLQTAEHYAQQQGLTVMAVIKVPGTYDVPIAAQRLLQRDDVDALVTLGAVIKGETQHDEVIAFSTAKTLQELSLQYNKPIALGIAGPGMTWEQADARKEEYAKRAVDAARDLVRV